MRRRWDLSYCPKKEYPQVTCLWGWSGKPAPSFLDPSNSSSIRNGSRFLSSGRPMLRRTLAPRPSLCHLLSTTAWTLRIAPLHPETSDGWADCWVERSPTGIVWLLFWARQNHHKMMGTIGIDMFLLAQIRALYVILYRNCSAKAVPLCFSFRIKHFSRESPS